MDAQDVLDLEVFFSVSLAQFLDALVDKIHENTYGKLPVVQLQSYHLLKTVMYPNL
jgi:hypothetical protein